MSIQVLTVNLWRKRLLINERPLIPSELSLALEQEALARQQAERRAEEAEQAQRQTQQQLERLQAKLQAWVSIRMISLRSLGRWVVSVVLLKTLRG